MKRGVGIVLGQALVAQTVTRQRHRLMLGQRHPDDLTIHLLAIQVAHCFGHGEGNKNQYFLSFRNLRSVFCFVFLNYKCSGNDSDALKTCHLVGKTGVKLDYIEINSNKCCISVCSVNWK